MTKFLSFVDVYRVSFVDALSSAQLWLETPSSILQAPRQWNKTDCRTASQNLGFWILYISNLSQIVILVYSGLFANVPFLCSSDKWLHISKPRRQRLTFFTSQLPSPASSLKDGRLLIDQWPLIYYQIRLPSLMVFKYAPISFEPVVSWNYYGKPSHSWPQHLSYPCICNFIHVTLNQRFLYLRIRIDQFIN